MEPRAHHHASSGSQALTGTSSTGTQASTGTRAEVPRPPSAPDSARSDAVVQIRSISKTFAGRRSFRDLVAFWRKPTSHIALSDVSFDVKSGELVALVGPNGAGKTTLLKALAGLVAPSTGTAIVDGIDVAAEPDRARARVGYVLADERSFFWRISCKENLLFFAALDGLFGAEAVDRIAAVSRLVGLEDLLARPFMDLSQGQRQRAAIARGLLSDPPVLLFDEATRSLDPGRATRLRRVIREVLVETGRKAVLFATHDLDEARLWADRVVLMLEGRVDRMGPYEEIGDRVEQVFRDEAEREDRAEFGLRGSAETTSGVGV